MKSVLYRAGNNQVQVSGAFAEFKDNSFGDLVKEPSFMAFEIGRFLRNYTKQQLKSIEREFFAIELLTTQKKYFSDLVPQTKANSFLNRYPTCIPFEKNIVPSTRYLNASFISGAKTPEQSKLYIATQAPLTYTIPEFIHMAITQNCGSIFTLCGLEDCKKGACEVYWPEANSKSSFGDYTVSTLTETPKNGYIHRNLLLAHGSETKSINHFQYLNWPDTKVPSDTESFLQLLAELKTAEQAPGKKIIVHCSAGVGRTGTLLALSQLKTILDEQYERKLDYGVSVFSVVRRLREQRMHMVQSVEQYDFINTLVEKWADEWNKQAGPENKDDASKGNEK